MIITNNNEAFTISPLLDGNSNIPFTFDSVTISESVLSGVPEIVLELTADQDLAELNSEHTLVLKLSNGLKIESKCYLYDIRYNLTHQTLKLLVCNQKFIKEPHTNTYSNINSAINACFNDNVINKPITTDNTRLYQKNETGINFLSRVLLGYKKNTLFGYSLKGLKFLDLDNSIVKDTYSLLDWFNQTKPIEITKPVNYDFEVKVVDKFTNHTKLKFGNTMIDVDNNYSDYLNTMLHNSNILNKHKGSLGTEVHIIPPIDLLDMVNFKSREGKVTNYYVVSKVIVIDNSTSSTKYVFNSIKPNDKS